MGGGAVCMECEISYLQFRILCCFFGTSRANFALFDGDFYTN